MCSLLKVSFFSAQYASKIHPCFTHGVLHLLPLGVIFHYVSTSYSVYHFPVNGRFRRVQSLAPISSAAVSIPERASVCLGVTFVWKGRCITRSPVCAS